MPCVPARHLVHKFYLWGHKLSLWHSARRPNYHGARCSACWPAIHDGIEGIGRRHPCAVCSRSVGHLPILPGGYPVLQAVGRGMRATMGWLMWAYAIRQSDWPCISMAYITLLVALRITHNMSYNVAASYSHNYQEFYMRTCTRCGESDQTKFYKNIHSWCAACHREAVRNGRYKKLGVSRAEYLAVLHGQLGACDICGKQETPVQNGTRGLHLDHDHKTGKRRGILCSRCNQVLGRVQEDVSILQTMIAYINKHL